MIANNMIIEDLSTRIPYEVICEVKFDTSDYGESRGKLISGILKADAELLGYNHADKHIDINVISKTPEGDYISEQAAMGLITINDITPYLHSIYLMTDEEKDVMVELGLAYYDSGIYENEDGEKIIYGDKTFQIIPDINSYDWLISHYFDIRDLIPNNQAIEAPENMYTEKIKAYEQRRAANK